MSGRALDVVPGNGTDALSVALCFGLASEHKLLRDALADVASRRENEQVTATTASAVFADMGVHDGKLRHSQQHCCMGEA